MVHALEQAWRVLRTNGELVDIHPAITHTQVGYCRARSFVFVGSSGFPLIHYRDASRALRYVRAAGLFQQRTSKTFECMTYAPLGELAYWLTNSSEPGAAEQSERLVKRATQAMKADPQGDRVGARERIIVRVLQKADIGSRRR
jgi:hypothetical protein